MKNSSRLNLEVTKRLFLPYRRRPLLQLMLARMLLERGCSKNKLTLNFRLTSMSKLGLIGSSMCMTGHRMNLKFMMTTQIPRIIVMNTKQTSSTQWLWIIPRAFDHDDTRIIFRAE